MGRINNTAQIEHGTNLATQVEKISGLQSRYAVLNDEALRIMELAIRAERNRKIQKIKAQLARGKYHVNSNIVARAMCGLGG